MKLYLGLTESSAPHQTRLFADSDNQLVDLGLAYTACLTASHFFFATSTAMGGRSSGRATEPPFGGATEHRRSENA